MGFGGSLTVTGSNFNLDTANRGGSIYVDLINNTVVIQNNTFGPNDSATNNNGTDIFVALPPATGFVQGTVNGQTTGTGYVQRLDHTKYLYRK